MTATLARLFVHPVKSAAGIDCAEATLQATGLAHDREWMIVDAAGRFLTQREAPLLALLQVQILAPDVLQLSTPAGSSLRLSLTHPGAAVEVRVWRSQCLAFDAGDDAARLLSEFLDRPVRLVRFDSRRARHSDPAWTDGRDVPNYFSDGYPLLVLSQASIDDLARRVGRPLDARRFRPNLLLEGVAPYAEDAATRLEVGGVTLQLTKACTRCVITTLDPATGARIDDEPLTTLKGYRYDPALRGVVFGRNAYVIQGAGLTLSRGQSVSLV